MVSFGTREKLNNRGRKERYSLPLSTAMELTKEIVGGEGLERARSMRLRRPWIFDLNDGSIKKKAGARDGFEV